MHEIDTLTWCLQRAADSFLAPPSMPSARLPSLSPAAKARLKAAEQSARSKLGLTLNRFVLDCSSGKLRRRLDRNPNSRDLIQIFLRYALRVLDANARELLAAFDSPERYARILDEIANEIALKVRGLWPTIVEKTCEDANMIAFGDSQAGYYHPQNLMRPHIQPIRAALLLRNKHWEGQAWEKLASALPGSDQGITAGKVSLKMRGREETSAPESMARKLTVATAQSGSLRKANPDITSTPPRRREPHPDPERILRANPAGVTYKTVAELAGVGVRRIQQLVDEGRLKAIGTGNSKRVTVASVRKHLGLAEDFAKKSEKPRNAE
jgi:excisionase family DNA binding protein